MLFSRNAIQLVRVFVCSFLFIMSAVQASSNIDEGLDWLESHVSPLDEYDGGSEIVYAERASFEALMALLGNGRSVPASILTSIIETDFTDSISISRSILLSAIEGVDSSEKLASLVSRLNSDGGLGSQSHGESTVPDTSFALTSLAVAGASQSDLDSLVGYLLKVQGADGSWRYADGIPSVALTAHVIKALWTVRNLTNYDVSTAVLLARQYVLAEVDLTSGIWSTTAETAVVLSAIYPTYTDSLPLAQYMERLQQQQLPDGSWSDRAFETALAIQAINSDLVDELMNSQPTAVNGRVMDGDTNALISDGVAVLEAGVNIYSDDITNGQYSFPDVEAGTYSLRLAVAGYETTVVDSVDILAQYNRTLGDIKIFSEPSSAVVRGTVTDSISGQALSGITVLVTGVDSYIAITDGEGKFVVSGVTPGSISILINETDFQVASASATATAGQSLLFNPQLKPNTVNVSVPLVDTPLQSIITFIVTDEEGDVVSLARVNAVHSGIADVIQLSTSGTGTTSWQAEQEGELSFTISRTGYKSVTGLASVVMGHNLNLIITMPKEGSSEVVEVIDNQDPVVGLPSYSELMVKVVDRSSGLPIGNAQINLDGSQFLSVQTNIDGSYTTQEFGSEVVSIQISATGYIDEAGEVDLFIGNKTELMVELLADGVADERLSSVIGNVIDSVSTIELLGASASLWDDSGLLVSSWSSNASNMIELIDVVPGSYLLMVSASGYSDSSLSFIVDSGVSVNLGDIALTEILPAPLLMGAIIDENTGSPINGAIVSSSTGGQYTVTDNDGLYSLSDLPLGETQLVINASGYGQLSQLLNLDENRAYVLDVALSVASGIGVSITESSLVNSEFQSYEAVQEQLLLENSSSVSRLVELEFSLVNENDEVLLYKQGLDELGNVVQQPGFIAPANNLSTMTLEWNTANIESGYYRAVYRLMTADDGLGSNSLVLHQVVKDITISSRQYLQSATILNDSDVAPSVGESYSFSPLIEVKNESNQESPLAFLLQLKNSSDSVLDSYLWDYGVIYPADTSLAIQLPELSFVIPSEDEYYFEVVTTLAYGNQLTTKTDSKLAAPSIRLDVEQSLSETVIYPNEDKGITVTIEIEGKEYFGEL